MASGVDHPFFNLPSGEKFDLDEYLKKDVDLSKYFNQTELSEMGYHKTRRLKNIVQNFEVMLHMGLPAIKPEFMKGPSYRARVAKSRQRTAQEAEDKVADSTKDDSDEEWTPDMERKKRQKENKLYPVPRFEKPKQTKRTKTNQHQSMNKKQKTDPAAAEKRSYDLREKTSTANYMILEAQDDDDFIYCEECDKEYDMDCPIHGALLFVPDTKVEMSNDPDHALYTLPAGLVVKTSTIPSAGLGVISQIEIPTRTMFGSYGGFRETDDEKAHASGYSWQIFKKGKPSHFVDAGNKANSNWMRYVNCARSEEEQNLVAFQYKGQIYYRTYKVIPPGTELLTWYGPEYGREMGIIRDKNTLLRPQYVKGEEYFPCVFCKTNFSTAVYCVRHLIQQHGKDRLTASDIQTLDSWLRENNHNRRNYHNIGVKSTRTPVQPFSQTQNTDHTEDKFVKPESERHLVVHNKTDTGEKHFKCDVCGSAFSQSITLIRHMRTHSGEKPFKCDVCASAFSQSITLIRHMRTHSGEKPFKCDVCSSAFSQNNILITHMRTHSGEKPFKCDVCSSAFSQNNILITHMRTHSGEKPFKCDVCGSAFSRKDVLIKHMRTHSGEKPFKCNV